MPSLGDAGSARSTSRVSCLTGALKASNQVGVRPMWYINELEDGEKKLNWATATRALRKLKARIIKVGGKREQPKEQAWRLEDAAQWELLFRG
jgi:hypothetical protein